jgi:hypothetical protein
MQRYMKLRAAQAFAFAFAFVADLRCFFANSGTRMACASV